ncbi:MAG: PQQ-dependent sugar dehydrogenase [Chloroflexi bacterium]|nr:MAG: PQQ-dependent sugar dehydrogenase [Chloroflexota bacterium]
MTRRLPAFTISAALLFVSALFPSGALAAAPTLSAHVVQSGLVNPWDIAFAPTSQMFVTERPGRVRVYAGGGIGATLLATTTLPNVQSDGEAGVMGIAVDHDFNANRLVYICVSRTVNGQWLNQLIRYKVTTDWHLEHDRTLIGLGMHANTFHDGCAVEEGPDHRIWLSMGDAGDAMAAQDPTALNGKILRITRNGGVPADNPIMPGTSQRSYVYSMGHRNPQGIAFQPGTGRVYAIEHGPDVNDEINWIRPGLNYGWPCVTGFGQAFMTCSGSPTFTDPVWASGGSTIANSGGTFVTGARWHGFAGQLFVSQLKESDLRRYTINPAGTTATYQQTLYDNRWGRLRASVLGLRKRLFLTTSNGVDDKVIRILPN